MRMCVKGYCCAMSLIYWPKLYGKLLMCVAIEVCNQANEKL